MAIYLMPSNLGTPGKLVTSAWWQKWRAIRRLQRVGLPTFHPVTMPKRVKVTARLCGSQILSIQDLFPWPFDLGTPALTRRRLPSVPCLPAVWTFLPAPLLTPEPMIVINSQQTLSVFNSYVRKGAGRPPGFLRNTLILPKK